MSQNVNLVPHFAANFSRQTFKIPASVDKGNILNTYKALCSLKETLSSSSP